MKVADSVPAVAANPVLALSSSKPVAPASLAGGFVIQQMAFFNLVFLFRSAKSWSNVVHPKPVEKEKVISTPVKAVAPTLEKPGIKTICAASLYLR